MQCSSDNTDNPSCNMFLYLVDPDHWKISLLVLRYFRFSREIEAYLSNHRKIGKFERMLSNTRLVFYDNNKRRLSFSKIIRWTSSSYKLHYSITALTVSSLSLLIMWSNYCITCPLTKLVTDANSIAQLSIVSQSPILLNSFIHRFFSILNF